MSASGLIIGGAVLGGLGSISGGINASNQAEFQAKQLKQQAKIEKVQELQQRRQLHRAAGAFRSTQEASAAASGIRLEGSALDAIAISEEEFARDEINLAISSRLRRANLRASSDLYRASGRSSLAGGFLGAGSGALTATALLSR